MTKKEQPRAPEPSASSAFEDYDAFRHYVRQPRFAIETLLDGLDRDEPGATRSRELILRAADAMERAALAAADLAFWALTPPPLDLRAASLRAVLHGSAEAARSAAQAAGLSFAYAVDDADIEADADVLSAVTDAALSNAVNFARSRIEVSARRIDGRVLVTIADDGPGLAPAFLPRIGEPFLIDWSRPSRDPIRLGLGLAAATRRAAALGGRIFYVENLNGALCTISAPA